MSISPQCSWLQTSVYSQACQMTPRPRLGGTGPRNTWQMMVPMKLRGTSSRDSISPATNLSAPKQQGRDVARHGSGQVGNSKKSNSRGLMQRPFYFSHASPV